MRILASSSAFPFKRGLTTHRPPLVVDQWCAIAVVGGRLWSGFLSICEFWILSFEDLSGTCVSDLAGVGRWTHGLRGLEEVIVTEIFETKHDIFGGSRCECLTVSEILLSCV